MRRLPVLLWLLLSAGCLYARQGNGLAVTEPPAQVAAEQVAAEQIAAEQPPMSRADSLIAYASTFLGKPYKLGAEGPAFYDCSSFVRAAFRGIGIELPRRTVSQILEGDGVCEGMSAVDQQEIRRGDIVLFGKRAGGIKDVGHVGIVVDVDLEHSDFTFIHCGVTHGVEFQKFSNPYYFMRYITCRRILQEE